MALDKEPVDCPVNDLLSQSGIERYQKNASLAEGTSVNDLLSQSEIESPAKHR